MTRNLELKDFTGEKLDKIFVKYLDLSVYDDDEDVIEDENSEITEIKNIAFVFGEKAIVINCLEDTSELTIEYVKWENKDGVWTEIREKSLTKYIGNKLIFLWRSLNLKFDLDDNYIDMCIFSFQTYPDIIIYSISSCLEIFETQKILIPPKAS